MGTAEDREMTTDAPGKLPTDSAARKRMPIVRGVLDYFPNAIAEVAECSLRANEQHSPGQPMHWAKGKSTDHADCLVRHLIDRGVRDVDGIRHTAKVAWRALALLQEEIEREQYGVAGEDTKTRHATQGDPQDLALMQRNCRDDG